MSTALPFAEKVTESAKIGVQFFSSCSSSIGFLFAPLIGFLPFTFVTSNRHLESVYRSISLPFATIFPVHLCCFVIDTIPAPFPLVATYLDDTGTPED